MTSSSAAYLLTAPQSSIGTKSTVIKQTLPKPLQATGSATLHSVHHAASHQLQYPFQRSSTSTNSHQQFSKMAPNGDTFQSLTPTSNNNATLLVTNNQHNVSNNTSSALTVNNNDDSGGGGGSGSGGHSLSQSMESINNIGLSDDEVS